MQATSANSNATGSLSAMAAMFFFSLNDVLIKTLSDAYPLHEVVMARSLIGMTTFLVIIMPLSGEWRALKTSRVGMHLRANLSGTEVWLLLYTDT